MGGTNTAEEGPGAEVQQLFVARRGFGDRLSASPEGLRQRGAAAVARGARTEARAALTRALELAPGHERGRIDLARQLVEEGSFGEAVGVLAALGENPCTEALFLRCRALVEGGQAGRAVGPLERLLRQIPGDEEVRALYAEALVETGSPQGRRQIGAVLKKNPGQGRAWLAYSKLLMEEGEALVALEHLDRAKVSPGREVMVAALRAEALLEAGMLEEASWAAEHLELTGGRCPLSVAVQAGIRVKQGKEAEAQALLEGFELTGELEERGQLWLAKARLQRGQYKRGLEGLHTNNFGNPRRASQAWALRGRLLEGMGEGEAAMVAYEEAHGLVGEGMGGDWRALVEESRRLGGRGARSGGTRKGPLLVVGAPGSGVGLVGDLLAAHPQLMRQNRPGLHSLLVRSIGGPFGELPDKLKDLSEVQVEQLGRRWGGSSGRVVEADVRTLAHLGLVSRVFPQAEVVLVERDPVDAGLSWWAAAPGPSSPRSPFEAGQLVRLAQELGQEWMRSLPIKIRRVRYEALVACPDRVLGGLFRDLGLSFRSVAHLGERRGGGPPGGARPLGGESVGRWTQLPRLAQEIARGVRDYR